MNLINDGASSILEEEDRISNLSDDIIRRILSFLDMKYVVQTCTLSKRWKYIWTSMPCLNLNSDTFCCMHNFVKFVEHVLYQRNNQLEVSGVELAFTGATTQFFVKDIVEYAYFHNVRQMTMKWLTVTVHLLPECIFTSYTLKHLTLNDEAYGSKHSRIANSAWDFPALETLNLVNIRLGDGNDKSLDLFPKCVNLKDLTLHKCSMCGLEIFTIRAPQLSNLTITEFTVFPKVFKLAAPKLKTLTASVSSRSGGLGFNILRLSTEVFGSLEWVNLSLSNNRYKKENIVPPLLDLFNKLSNAKFLVFDVDIIECLSSCLDQLSNEPCPFNNLKGLKINVVRLKQDNHIPKIPTQVRNYFLENSPSATLIIDSPQVCLAEENRMLVAKKRIQDQLIAKLKTKLHKKDQEIAKLNQNIEMKDQVIAKQNTDIQMLKVNNIHMRSHVPASSLTPRPSLSNFPHKRSREQGPNDTIPKKVVKLEAETKLLDTMDEENRMLKEKIQMQDQLIANLKTKLQTADQVIANQKEDIQLKEEVIAEQNTSIQMLKSYNVHKQSYVPAPFPVSRPSSWNVPHTRPRQQLPADANHKNVAKSGVKNKLPETVAEDNRMLGANIQFPDRVIADLKRKLHMKDQVIANQNANIQMKDKVIAKLNADIQMLKSDKIPMQTYVPGPPPVPRPSSSNKTASSRHEAVGSFNLHKLSE